MIPTMSQLSFVETDGRGVTDGDDNGVGFGNEPVENVGGSTNCGTGKKKYHRHNNHQTQQLENFFKTCPNPNDKQRKLLSRNLALEPLQVRFWFQNKRNQIKLQHERHENFQIQLEHETLHAQNMKLIDILTNSTCRACGGPNVVNDLSFHEHHLRMENVRLKDMIDRMTNALDLKKQVVANVACAAMDELVFMIQTLEPMWIPVSIDGYTTYLLNEEEYSRSLFRSWPRRPGFRSEATRDSAIVKTTHTNIITALMNVNQWATLFCEIVAKAIPLEQLAIGRDGSYDGALQLIHAEYQIITPLVPTRETTLVRYCKQRGEGIWVVVDVSLDGMKADSLTRFQKRASGCVIQQLPDGYSEITWIEHVDVEDKGNEGIYRSVISSGAGFGAKYWLSILNGKIERFSCCGATDLPTNEVNNIEGRKILLKLGERIMTGFCSRVGASDANNWTTLSLIGHDEVKVMTHKSVNEQGCHNGIVISVATSICLPTAPRKVFDFFFDGNNRAKWDILINGANMYQMENIPTGELAGNAIKLSHMNGIPENPNSMLILQESFAYPTGFFIVYSPIEPSDMTAVLDSGDINSVRLLPSGFAILPNGSGGSLLTLSLQFLVNSAIDAKLSHADLTSAFSLMSGTLDRVRAFIGMPSNSE